MRPPLPSVYDANAISAHFSGAAGASALRQRAFFIASTASSILLPSTSIATSIEALGATFIKFGQAAANRPDLVGPAIADELRLLQDSCAPFSRDQVIQAIREDLPDDAAEEVLAALPDEPSAAASLGQVYRLTLPSQRDPIALKILRPGAREAVALDALLARNAATIPPISPCIATARTYRTRPKKALRTFFSNGLMPFSSHLAASHFVLQSKMARCVSFMHR